MTFTGSPPISEKDANRRLLKGSCRIPLTFFDSLEVVCICAMTVIAEEGFRRSNMLMTPLSFPTASSCECCGNQHKEIAESLDLLGIIIFLIKKSQRLTQ